MQLTEKIQRAINLASRLHFGQQRKGNDNLPYISHPFAVAWLISNYTDDEDVVVAALLHDVLEDVPGYYLADLEKEFGTKIATLVHDVSEDKDPNISSNDRETWEIRKNGYLKHLQQATPEAWLICCADKVQNLQSLQASYNEKGDGLWSEFNSPKDKKIWFYERVYEFLQENLHSPLVDVFRTEIIKAKQNLKI